MSLDSLVFFFYLIISQEILILKNTLEFIILPRNIKIILPVKKTNPELKQWLELRKKIVALADQTNDFFSPVMALVISMSTISICSHTFTAANYATSLTIVSVLFMYIFWVGTQIFCYCMVGQILRNCSDALNKEIYRLPWMENFSTHCYAMIPILHMISVDSQQSFAVKISTLLTFNYEFFISIISFVLTYFFVLYQFSDSE
ncbi:Hypothetical predicted protein [Cloeon dipterum]|uniref:Uncharacterized protein n=1 Tax=Cloeon dipterum TaxID=197152 RepID=A0A8S1DI90_9INSE|nr:Hypothetical predicted protein [Cloeon dipterum]